MWWLLVLLVLLVSGVVGLVLLAVVRHGDARWQSATCVLRSRIEGARVAIKPGTFDVAELASLPAPVRRYFEAVLQAGQPIVAAVSVEHSGSFNMGVTVKRWKPFTSTQRVITRRPGFDWDARVAMLSGLPVYVHDAYVAGEGILHAAVFGLLSVARLHGRGDVAQGELMRFFAEAAWYPTALLPSQGVHWTAVDGHSARATLTDGEIALTLLFGFGEDGLIDTVYAAARARTADEKAPWKGRFWNYAMRQGMRVPLEAEVAWILPAGPYPYWRGRITRLNYEFAA